MKTRKIGAISIIAALVLTLGVICGFTTSAVTNEKTAAETSIVDRALPANANNEENEKKPFQHYIFDDDGIREVSEDEFKSFLENNSEKIDIPNSVSEIRQYDPNLLEATDGDNDEGIMAMESPDFQETIEKMRQLTPEQIDNMREYYKNKYKNKIAE